MTREGEEARALIQEMYLQDLALTIYGIYRSRLRDSRGREILSDYLRGEAFRGAQIATYLERGGVVAPSAAVRSFFRTIGRIYGHLTSWLGTRMMLRIVLSASRRASRRACGALGEGDQPELLFLATLRARNEGDLLDALRQHMIDTAPRRAN